MDVITQPAVDDGFAVRGFQLNVPAVELLESRARFPARTRSTAALSPGDKRARAIGKLPRFSNHTARAWFSIAVRMLRILANAEDVLQDAYLRWHQGARRDIDSPIAFLVTITGRLCLDQGSVRATFDRNSRGNALLLSQKACAASTCRSCQALTMVPD